MENYIPRNSINTPQDNNEKLEHFKQENKRVRQNNMKLKLQVIETKIKLQKILKIINK
jgi:hypothetical protein